MTTLEARRLMDRRRNCIAAFTAVAVIALFVAVAIGAYQQVFTPTTDVRVHAARAGLLLDKGAQVRASGVKVGTVRSVEPAPGGGATLTLAIDRDRDRSIPRSTTATINATSVFGNKTVDLDIPKGEVTDPIRDGDILAATNVSTEVNDVFAQLKDVLDVVDPAALNTALSATATALDGRGDHLGALAGGLADYLATINGRRQAISTDIGTGAEVAATYGRASDDLLEVLKQAGRTSQTIADQKNDLRALLSGFIELADAGDALLQAIADPLALSLHRLRPVTASLARFSPEFTCLLSGMVKHRDAINSHLGTNVPGFQGNMSFLPAQHGYTTKRDLPRLIPNAVPHCLSLPGLAETNPPHHNFSDGSHAYDTAGTAGPTGDPVTLYSKVIGDWFGQSGMAALLGSPGGTKP